MKKIVCMFLALVMSALLWAKGAEVSKNGTIYEKVTALKSLVVGDTIVLVYEADSVAASSTLKTSGSSSYLDTIHIRLYDDKAFADSAMQLVVGKKGNYYTLTTTDGKTLGASKTKYVDLGSTTGTNDWTITFDNSDNASLKANLTSNVYLQYNTQNPRFTCYDGKQKAVQIYRRTLQKVDTIHVEQVSLDQTTLALRKGASSQLKAIIAPATADNQNVAWTSSETSVADVVDGLVTANAVGETTIMVTTEDGGKQATCLVTVTDSIHVTGIQMEHKVAGMKELTTLQLVASVLPLNADNQTIIWTSSDECVATVDANGLITAARYGQTLIIAASDEFPTMQDTCILTITAQPGDRYHLMTKDSVLRDGDSIVFYNATKMTASAGLVESGKYLEGQTAAKAGTDLIIEESQPMLLKKSGTYWNLSINSSPIGHNQTSDNSVDFNGSYSDFTLTIDDDAMATVKSQTTANPQFYCNNSGDFRLYNSTSMNPIQLYRKVTNPDVPIAVERVELDYDTLYLRADEQDQLEAYIYPEKAKIQDVEWGSTNEAVAAVQNGVVSALAKGESKIWVRTVDGDFTDTCYVRVYASLHQPDVTWNRLQSLDSLKEGTRVFFASVKQSENYVMGIYDYDVAKANIRGAAATFTNDYHTVTASESFAYTVSIENGKYIFRDLDGSYLCDYNQKNLSAQDNLDNKARWTGTMNEYFEFLFTNTYNTGYVIYNNHNSDMFCCYNAFDKSNLARIAIYADNAPEWVEPVRVPELHIIVDKDTITDVLDFGDVVYDDGWGTEVNPYEAAKTLTFKTKWLTDSIRLSLHKGVAFSLLTDVIRPDGGTASLQFSTDKNGVYSDTLYITCDTIVRQIVLTANAVTQEEAKPALTLSTKSITMSINLQETYQADAEMTFSVKNLKKNLYIKWEKGTIPSAAGESATVLVGNDATEIPFGGAPSFGTSTRTNEDILFETVAYTEGTYISTLCFYSPDETDKTKNAFEERVTITIHVTDTPTSLYDVTTDMENKKVLKDNQLLIYHNGLWYNTLGQMVHGK